MKKNYLFVLIVLAFYSCTTTPKNEITASHNNVTLYAPAVGDSFQIAVRLPEDYENSTTHYPVVLMTDANFHFPMLAATLNQYEKGGLLPPLILVGIGYKTFELMDSLRVRDYLYPAAIPSDEMTAPGGGENFYAFITSRLIPYIDSTYRTDKTNRTLLGHSFGGYFSLYALLNQLENKRDDFKTFVSASPALWYHDFYLNRLTGSLKKHDSTGTLNIFISAGALEDSTWNIAPVKNLAKQITNADLKNVRLQSVIYNNLEHMDVAQLSFIKGLQLYINPGN